MRSRQLIAKALMNPSEGTPLFKTDAEALLFSRQVEQILAETYTREFPDLLMANGDIIPINRQIKKGTRTWVYYTYEPAGVARIMDSYADTNIPKTTLTATENIGKTVGTNTYFGWHVDELEDAATGNVPLTSMLADHDKYIHARLWNRVGWFGAPERGIYGLATHPNVSHTLAPLNAGATSRLWSAKTFDEIIADFATLINTPLYLTNGMERVTNVVLPGAVWTALEGRPMNTTNSANFTIADWIRKSYPGVTFTTDWYLDAANHADVPEFAGLNVAVAYNKNESKASLVIPQPYETYQPRWEKLHFNTYTGSKCGGAMIPFPLSVHVLRGF